MCLLHPLQLTFVTQPDRDKQLTAQTIQGHMEGAFQQCGKAEAGDCLPASVPSYKALWKASVGKQAT